MRSSYMKLLLRSVKKTAARFLSILAIVAVGVGFLSGLMATTPDMQLTADRYYDDNRLFDLDIRGTLGLTDSDVSALSASDVVDGVMPAYVTDVSMSVGDASFVTRVYGVPLGRHGTDLINDVVLVSGRMPESKSECLVVEPDKYIQSRSVGETIRLSDDSRKGGSLGDVYNFTELTVVGIVHSPYYMSIEREPSTVGTGNVGLVIFVFPECFTLSAYTDIFVTLRDAAALDTFSDAYDTKVDAAKDAITTLGTQRCETRYSELYDEASSEIDRAKTELNGKKAELDSARNEMDAAWTALREQRSKLESALRNPLLTDAQRQSIEAGLQSVGTAETALREKESALGGASEELIQAEARIADSESALQKLEVPEWYITGRSDTVSYSSYRSNSDKIRAIAKVFPVFFFIVAALVALTTMTRMVEEERTQIGTLKALGYSKAAITAYYLGYCILASVLGSFFGSAVGFSLLPLNIVHAYTMMYTLPEVIAPFRWDYAMRIMPAAVACTVAATLWACLSQLSEKPSELMLPRAPKPGKRILLERIGFLWKRMRFTEKVTARNIMRYKKRFYMTVFGIAGCCALLLTGFGLRDSINDIVDIQFGQIYKYNLSVYLKSGTDPDGGILAPVLRDETRIAEYAVLHFEACTVSLSGKEERASLYVPETTGQIKQMYTLRERKSGADIPFEDNSLILTEKLCEKLGVGVGDSVTIRSAGGASAQFTVTGVMENYVMAYAFISEPAYINAFGEQPDRQLVLAKTADKSQAGRDALSQALLKSDDVLLLQYTETIRESFSNTVKNIDYIVLVLIFSAGLLAVIVLYNLTNINICERKRELATIKVLGFHEKEVAAYIYRETTILCLVGIAFGFVFGVWLHAFVVRTAEVDAVMFGRRVYLHSYLYAAAVTAGFTALVDAVMLLKLKAIDMVESMKANE